MRARDSAAVRVGGRGWAKNALARVADGSVDRRSRDVLVRAVGVFGGTVGLAGGFWGVVGLIVGEWTLVGVGIVATAFGAFLLLDRHRSPDDSAAALAARVAIVTEATAAVAVLIEPVIGPAIALGSLIPVVAALLYVDRRTLTLLMLGSAAVGVFGTLAPSVLTWGVRDVEPFGLLLPTTTLIVVYLLFQVFLWNASTRMADTAAELRHVVEMSRDLAGTLDPALVGDNLARHLVSASGARDATLSTWDRENGRLVTFGYHPQAAPSALEPSYDLRQYPATLAVLVEQRPLVVDLDDPGADVAEVGYLRSIGRRRLVMLPLVVRGESIGIVELTADDPHAFGEHQVELASVLTREAALTFDNARLHAEIREQAFRDPLTGLANRARFQERVDHALARLRGRSPLHVAVLFIDLDHFKLVNDRFGHTMGDRLLRVVAERVRTSVRPGDTAARLGGDEFAVLLEDVEGGDEAAAVCRRLLERFAEPIDLGDAAPTIGASIGEAMSGFGGETADELLRNADIAMYAAKAAGRGQVVTFRSELLDLAAARSELAALLRGADTRNELQLHFQPIVELATGVPTGMEALVRWQPPGHNLHMPSEFIGLAEETGEILSIGRWVLGEACRKLRTWQDRFDLPNLRMYVNLSARQFRDPNLLEIVASAVEYAQLDPAHLTLEITESALLIRTPDTLERIRQLRHLGVRLAIDDFGTGYSSLGYLHAFQVDELKIDRSFVSGPSQPKDAVVLSRAIVELGRALGLDMVAEGIETRGQADLFLGLGCRYGQGYLFAKPLAPADVDRFFRRQRTAGRAAARLAARRLSPGHA